MGTERKNQDALPPMDVKLCNKMESPGVVRRTGRTMEFSLKHFILFLTLVIAGSVSAAEKKIASLRDFRTEELKTVGLKLSKPVKVRISALGAGGDSGWMLGDDGIFAAAWIINAKTRAGVWEMNAGNTTKADGDYRKCDERITLQPGEYELLFSVPIFSYRTWKSNVVLNIDHRRDKLFGGDGEDDPWYLKGWWTDDIPEIWEKVAKEWGVDLYVDDQDRSAIETFSPPAKPKNIVFAASGLGDGSFIRQGLTVANPVTVNLYALGEQQKEGEPVDFGWILDADTRTPVWEMNSRNTSHAGGADKNKLYAGSLRLKKGKYVLYYITDDSHSTEDWNAFPPFDPLNWGSTVSVNSPEEARSIELYDYEELANIIVDLSRVGNEEHRQEGFALKEPARIRIYAFGERSHSRRQLADYGYIMDSRTREKVWVMDVDRCRQAGGDSKNVVADDIVTLPGGAYLVTYTTDDSHAYGDWNAAPPYDEDHYGITVMLAGENPKKSVIGTYKDQRQEGMIEQIVGVGDNADESKRFSLDRPTRVRVYAIGEGQKRSMYDYGWIESVGKGVTVWEMTYGMSFHAGGARKNRVVNTTILLEKGEYLLRYQSDDSHSFGDWNEDPPDDQMYWGITLYKDNSDTPLPPVPPDSPVAPDPY